MRNTPETVIKNFGQIVRMGGVESAIQGAIETGSTEQLAAFKQYEKGVTAMGDISGTAFFDGLAPLVRRRSLIGQIAELKPFFNVPANARILAEDAGATAGFLLEGHPAPLSSSDLSTVTLQPKTIRSLQVVTDEIAKMPNLEHVLARGLIRATAVAESQTFASAAAATPEAPAGVFSGVSPVSGTADLADDFQTLVDAFEGDLSESVLLVHPKTAVKLASVYPTAGLSGDAAGLPIVAHRAIADGTLAILEPGRIKMCDAGMFVEQSDEATLLTPDGRQVSLFQQNLVGFRITRYITWEPAPDAVAALSGGTW